MNTNYARQGFAWRCLALPAALVLTMLTSHANAVCPTDAAIDAYVADFAARRISKGFGNEINAVDAECAKKKLSSKLRKVLGDPVGYKAGFTSVALQQRFNVDGPRWGYMYDRDMIDILAVVPAEFGARPLYEADFIVVAKDAGLADATEWG